MAESQQHKLDRVRPPRVQITYDVETNGAMEKKELPFVVGVMAELSGHRDKELGRLTDRKFEQIDRDNFDAKLANAAPTLSLTVDNTLSGDGSRMKASLAFKSMDDFAPAAVARQIPALKELLEMRGRLDQILSSLQTNTQLDDILQEVLASTDKVQKLAAEMGIASTPPTPPEGK